jgi:hypothetical protein
VAGELISERDGPSIYTLISFTTLQKSLVEKLNVFFENKLYKNTTFPNIPPTNPFPKCNKISIALTKRLLIKNHFRPFSIFLWL